MQSIKPIETIYNGYRFRSRLEARWAVFFDTLGITYEYESEGYDLGEGGWYLPDFWLPSLGCFIEIKPEEPDETACKKIECLAKLSNKKAYLFYGPIPYPQAVKWKTHGREEVHWQIQSENDSANVYNNFMVGTCEYGLSRCKGPCSYDSPNRKCVGYIEVVETCVDYYHNWCECPVCHKCGIEFEGRAARLQCACLRKLDPRNDRGENTASERLRSAYTAARSARFEHR